MYLLDVVKDGRHVAERGLTQVVVRGAGRLRAAHARALTLSHARALEEREVALVRLNTVRHQRYDTPSQTRHTHVYTNTYMYNEHKI